MTRRPMDINIYAAYHQYPDAFWKVTARTRIGQTDRRTDACAIASGIKQKQRVSHITQRVNLKKQRVGLKKQRKC